MALRRRLRPAETYYLRLGKGRIPISHDEYGIDWETMRTIVVDRAYELDYRGAVVLDIGAHRGCFGAYALERGARAVLSFEPEEANFGYLTRCAAAYREAGCDWQVHRAAVGSVSGAADLHVMASSWGHALSPSQHAAPDEVGVQRVPVVGTADVLAEAGELAGPGRLVVKVNAEGAECDIILGATAASWERVSDLMMEVHSWAPCTAAELIAHLADAQLSPSPGAVAWVHRLSRGTAV